MSLFNSLTAVYLLFAFAFEAFAIGFIALDEKCVKSRIGWMFLALISGPIGFAAYFIKGRN
jgi:hypothetical protein